MQCFSTVRIKNLQYGTVGGDQFETLMTS